jgi:hypothetical protein
MEMPGRRVPAWRPAGTDGTTTIGPPEAPLAAAAQRVQ